MSDVAITPPADSAECRWNDRTLFAAILLFWLIFSYALTSSSHVSFEDGLMLGSDDYLRLVQIRDFLNGQNWFDVWQHRMNAPDGAPMHWSRLADLPVALMIVLLTPVMGSTAAEAAAVVYTPALLFLCVMVLSAWIVLSLVGRTEALTAAIFTMGFGKIVFSFRATRIDHHGFQLICALALLYGLIARRSNAGAAIAAAAGAVWMQVSIEGLPYVFAASAILALQALFEPGARLRIVIYLGVLAGASIVLFLGTQPPRLWGADWCDAPTPGHLTALAFAAIGASPLALARANALSFRFLVLAGAGVFSAAGFALAAPQCLSAPFAALDPEIADLWYFMVGEGLPVWRLYPLEVAISFSPLLVAAVGYGLALRGVDRETRTQWLIAAAMFVFALIIAVFVRRAYAAAALFSLPGLAYLVRLSIARIRLNADPVMRVMLGVLVFLVIFPSTPQMLMKNLGRLTGFDRATPLVKVSYVDYARDRDPTTEQAAKTADMNSLCRKADHFSEFTKKPQTHVLAPLNITPALLVHTRHVAVASGHHRNLEAMKDVIDFYTGSSSQAREIVLRRGVEAVVFCDDLHEIERYAAYSPDGLAAQMLAGAPPDWLQLEAPEGAGPLRIWRVAD